MPNMEQKDWSDFAKEAGPGTRQPEMVSREKVIEVIEIRIAAVVGLYPENTERRLLHHLNMLKAEVTEEL